MFPSVTKLTAKDIERYIPLRMQMLTDAPWAFEATPDKDRALDQEDLARSLSRPDFAIFALEADKQSSVLVAATGIVRMDNPKFRHRAKIWGVFVDPAYRGRGYGRALMQSALTLARSWRDLSYVDLGVSENSPAALALYESLGFREWGREPATTRHDGSYYDEIHLSLKL